MNLVPPCFITLIELMLAISHSTAKAERSFSHMNLIKTSQRQSMNQDLLQDLMLINIEGPPLKEYNPQPAIEHWLNCGTRPRYNLEYKSTTNHIPLAVGKKV